MTVSVRLLALCASGAVLLSLPALVSAHAQGTAPIYNSGSKTTAQKSQSSGFLFSKKSHNGRTARLAPGADILSFEERMALNQEQDRARSLAAAQERLALIDTRIPEMLNDTRQGLAARQGSYATAPASLSSSGGGAAAGGGTVVAPVQKSSGPFRIFKFNKRD